MLGNSRIRDCELDKAITAYEKGLSLVNMHSRPDLRHPLMDTKGNLARAHLLKGRAEESKLVFTDVINSTLEGKKRAGIVTANWTIRRGEAEKLRGKSRGDNL